MAIWGGPTSTLKGIAGSFRFLLGYTRVQGSVAGRYARMARVLYPDRHGGGHSGGPDVCRGFGWLHQLEPPRRPARFPFGHSRTFQQRAVRLAVRPCATVGGGGVRVPGRRDRLHRDVIL